MLTFVAKMTKSVFWFVIFLIIANIALLTFSAIQLF